MINGELTPEERYRIESTPVHWVIYHKCAFDRDGRMLSGRVYTREEWDEFQRQERLKEMG